jgi:hypothetical protein
MTATSQPSLTLRLSQLISSADYDPVGRCVCVVFCLLGDSGVAFLYARVSFPSTGIRDFLCGPIDSWHLSKMLFSAREHLTSHWLDLAEGRLRLDRLTATASVRLSSPGLRPFLAKQESLTAAILRCAAAQAGAASIAFGFQIAIEAAVVAELEKSKEK